MNLSGFAAGMERDVSEFFYVMYDPSDKAIKIGMSVDPPRRLERLQISRPRLKLLGYGGEGLGREIEKGAKMWLRDHLYMKPNGRRSEWIFHVDGYAWFILNILITQVETLRVLGDVSDMPELIYMMDNAIHKMLVDEVHRRVDKANERIT